MLTVHVSSIADSVLDVVMSQMRWAGYITRKGETENILAAVKLIASRHGRDCLVDAVTRISRLKGNVTIEYTLDLADQLCQISEFCPAGTRLSCSIYTRGIF